MYSIPNVSPEAPKGRSILAQCEALGKSIKRLFIRALNGHNNYFALTELKNNILLCLLYYPVLRTGLIYVALSGLKK